MKGLVTRNVLGSFILLLVVLLGAYYWLGGFKSIKIEAIDVNNYYLVGRYFEGTYQSDTVRDYFSEMKGYIDGQVIKGQPAIIYQQEPTSRRGHIKCFVGIKTDRTTQPIPDLKVKEITVQKAIRLSKDGHISVMPNPDRIERMILTYAADHRFMLDSYNIEIYYPQNRLVIERPVLSKGF